MSISEVTDRLNKIMWFNSHNEYFNYLIVRGDKQVTNMQAEDLMILQHLIVKLGTERGDNMNWLADPKIFMRYIKWAMQWARDKQNALIFKYRPSEDVVKANSNFEMMKHSYLRTMRDDKYNKMYEAFKTFYDILGK